MRRMCGQRRRPVATPSAPRTTRYRGPGARLGRRGGPPLAGLGGRFIDGLDVPRSHRLISDFFVARRSASCSCVRSSPSRASRMRFPNRRRMSSTATERKKRRDPMRVTAGELPLHAPYRRGHDESSDTGSFNPIKFGNDCKVFSGLATRSAACLIRRAPGHRHGPKGDPDDARDLLAPPEDRNPQKHKTPRPGGGGACGDAGVLTT